MADLQEELNSAYADRERKSHQHQHREHCQQGQLAAKVGDQRMLVLLACFLLEVVDCQQSPWCSVTTWKPAQMRSDTFNACLHIMIECLVGHV